MSNNYEVLYGKYQRALVSIRELELELERSRDKMAEVDETRQIVEQQTKNLCETILKKENGNNDKKAWFKHDILEMIQTAQTSLDGYFPSIEGKLRQILEKNREQMRELAKLRREFEESTETLKKKHAAEIKIKDEIIKRLENDLLTGRKSFEEIHEMKKDVIDKETKNTDANLDDLGLYGNSLGIETEESDELGEVITNEMDEQHVKNKMKTNNQHKGKGSRNSPSGPPVQHDEKTREATRKRIEGIHEQKKTDIAKAAAELGKAVRFTIRVIGTTGLSEAKDMKYYVKEQIKKKNYPDTTLASWIPTAFNMDANNKNCHGTAYFDHMPVDVPGAGRFKAYKLSPVGEEMFRYLFPGEEMKESEYDVLLRHHGKPEHGYGIKKAAKIIRELPCVKNGNPQIEYLTRTPTNTLKLDNDSRYIPDIVLKYTNESGKNIHMNFEYETNKCADTDMIKKCRKMSRCTSQMYFIVDSKEDVGKIKEKIKKWETEVKNGTSSIDKKVTVYIGALSILKKEEKFKWEESWSISPNKKTGDSA